MKPVERTSLVGHTISRYEILELLGGGGMGRVYKARDLRLGRFVAMKFLPEELSEQEQALERFKREARAASHLNHPNICTLYDFGEDDGRSFILMELLEGRNLRKSLEEGPLPFRKLLKLALEAAEALDYAHEKGIVHRDVKPENLFETDSGRFKVLDFGLAKVQRHRAETPFGEDEFSTAVDYQITTQGAAIGTVSYMSPQQVSGDPLDRRTDIFSLGVVLYEMAAGRRPFTGRTPGVVCSNILTAEPPRLTTLSSQVSEDFERVVCKALMKDPAQRYQSARDLLADLRSLSVPASESGSRSLPSRTAQPETEPEPIRTVIVDDEDLARQVLREYLEEFPEIEIVAECSNGFEAVKTIGETGPDLVFLDIQMPKLTGFEVLELLDRPPAVIFCTAFDEYAIQAFEVNAVDYLLKPFPPERLAEALKRVEKELDKSASYSVTQLAAAARPEGKRLDRILVKEGDRALVVPVDSIDYLEAVGDGVRIYAGAECHEKPKSISALADHLDGNHFVSIHDRYLLNVGSLERIETSPTGQRSAVVRGGKRLPVSKAGHSRLQEVL